MLDKIAAIAGSAIRAACIVSFGTAPTGDHATRILIDAEGHAAAAWEPGAGALFAVRPDGVVGFTSDHQDGTALTD
jgi:hypothetical protein